MSSEYTMVNWCPGDGCDPCHCHWEPFTSIVEPWLYEMDGTVSWHNFCAGFFLGIGATCPIGGVIGDIVDGQITCSIQTDFAQYTNTLPLLPPVTVYPEPTAQLPGGTVLYSLPVNSGVIIPNAPSGGPMTASGYDSTGAAIYSGIWTGLTTLTLPGCVRRNTSGSCVLPLSFSVPGSIPDVAHITPAWVDPTPSLPTVFSLNYHLSGGIWVHTVSPPVGLYTPDSNAIWLGESGAHCTAPFYVFKRRI